MDNWLITCRSGFERELRAEADNLFAPASDEFRAKPGAGWIICEGDFKRSDRKPWKAVTAKSMIFSRQSIYIFGEIEGLHKGEIVESIVEAALDWRKSERMARGYSNVFVEAPDTGEGRKLWPFCSSLEPRIKEGLEREGLIPKSTRGLPRLHLFFTSPSTAYIGITDPVLSSPWPMGIPRLNLPDEAPGRSATKLEEAINFFIPSNQIEGRLRGGMKAVDLGAAPGGWSWILARRGILVEAIDNRPLKPAALASGLVTHVKADGYRYRPERPKHWLFCDIVAPAPRVSNLITNWAKNGLFREAIFNLQLPDSRRLATIEKALSSIKRGVEESGGRCEARAKHLYHDKLEVTCHVRITEPCTKKTAPKKRAAKKPLKKLGRRQGRAKR